MFEPLKYFYAHNEGLTKDPTIDYDMLMGYFEKMANVYDPRTKKNYLRCMLKNGWITEIIPDDEKEAIKQHLGLDQQNRTFKINLKAKQKTQMQKLEEFKHTILGND